MAKNTNRLRVLRAETGVSQLDTALAANIPQHRYWLIENGYRAPTPKERKAIARALKAQESDAFPEALAS